MSLELVSASNKRNRARSDVNFFFLSKTNFSCYAHIVSSATLHSLGFVESTTENQLKEIN